MARFERERVFEFAASAERIWPAIAQTNLVAEIIGGRTYETVDELQPDGSVLRRASGDILRPITTEWTEDLGEWVYARFCRLRRWFGRNDEQFVEHQIALEPADRTTKVSIRYEMNASSLTFVLGVRLGLIARHVDRLIASQVAIINGEIARAEALAAEENGDPLDHLPLKPAPLDAQTIQQLEEAGQALRALTGDVPLADRLVDFLKRAPNDFLGRVRPLELARTWGADRDKTVDLFLAAHRARLLSLRWEVLCPRCRNSQTPSTTLEDLPRTVHCSTCNIDYERDFSRNVELLFEPEPWLRPLPEGAACMLGASRTPHIVLQRHVDAGQSLSVDPPLNAGSYRVRAIQLEDDLEFDWDGRMPFPGITLTDDSIVQSAPDDPGWIRIRNDGSKRMLVVVEELAWRQDALTGDQAIARAAFRRYCPEQLLRPGDEVQISNVVLMFTDLKGSTSLYETIGDTAAYKLVRDHFDYLNAVIENHRGTRVKTMGDAIMAAFSAAEDAVTAAIQLQTGVAGFNQERDDGGIVLKLGLHLGQCIAVTVDGQLDYFGSMVNLAARLQGESDGGDIVFSKDLVEAVDPSALSPGGARVEMTEASGTLRGFDEPVAYWRMTVMPEAA